ncbi:hypothetical protein D3C73_622010 [compost metagenome]
MTTTIYYRGTLSSCNYACPYCPFSKTKDNKETLAKDREQLQRFTSWVREQEPAGVRLSIFFNPYGEALVHHWYREALVELSHLPHVDKVAVQTNLSVKLDWTQKLNKDKAAFWATYHPGQTSEASFLASCSYLHKEGISFSVGAVGLKAYIEPIRSLRSALPEQVYLWINAYKDQPNYYSAEDVAFMRTIDPYFEWNLNDYASRGKACNTGQDVFFVTGSGQVKRCYKDRRVIGNLYRDGLAGISSNRPCGMTTCGCYIGYVHMPEMPFRSMYGSSLLERIPLVR